MEEIHFLLGMGNWSNAGAQIASASNILEVLVQLFDKRTGFSFLAKERQMLLRTEQGGFNCARVSLLSRGRLCQRKCLVVAKPKIKK